MVADRRLFERRGKDATVLMRFEMTHVGSVAQAVEAASINV